MRMLVQTLEFSDGKKVMFATASEQKAASFSSAPSAYGYKIGRIKLPSKEIMVDNNFFEIVEDDLHGECFHVSSKLVPLGMSLNAQYQNTDRPKVLSHEKYDEIIDNLVNVIGTRVDEEDGNVIDINGAITSDDPARVQAAVEYSKLRKMYSSYSEYREVLIPIEFELNKTHLIESNDSTITPDYGCMFAIDGISQRFVLKNSFLHKYARLTFIVNLIKDYLANLPKEILDQIEYTEAQRRNWDQHAIEFLKFNGNYVDVIERDRFKPVELGPYDYLAAERNKDKKNVLAALNLFVTKNYNISTSDCEFQLKKAIILLSKLDSLLETSRKIVPLKTSYQPHQSLINSIHKLISEKNDLLSEVKLQ